MPDQWSRQLFMALSRRYGLKPYRYRRQRHTTVVIRAPKGFIETAPWPEFTELNQALRTYLNGSDAARHSRRDLFRCERRAGSPGSAAVQLNGSSAQVASFNSVASRAHFHSHGRSSWRRLIFVPPDTMRSRTSVRYSCGSISLSLQVLMSDDKIAQVSPPRGLPAKR